MIDPTPHDPDGMQMSLDIFLRDVLPEVKLGLGTQIDRENARALPGRYARLLPETLLVATLRPDAAEAITPIAAEIERELTNSCTRHGSLYDRVYRVQLRRAEERDAPLFTVSTHTGHDLAAPDASAAPPPADAGAAGGPPAAAPGASAAAAGAPAGETMRAALPVADPDATRVDGPDAIPGWEAGRWLLVVEDEAGAEQEVFRVVEPFTTVGRRTDDPQLRVTVALSDVPHVSRRQLALLWDGEDPEPGFRVYNVGLNPLHVDEREIPGARAGRGALRLEEIDARHSARIAIERPVRIGEHGPILRIREIPATAEDDDPEATRFE
jgi:hypothetical protein